MDYNPYFYQYHVELMLLLQMELNLQRSLVEYLSVKIEYLYGTYHNTQIYDPQQYHDLYPKKICDNCGKCLEEDGIDIRAINIDDIAKNVEENAFIEEELKNALEALKEEESDLKEDLSEELTLDNYNDILDKLDSDEEYVDAFDNIVYFDELGVENDTELEELTEEIYPGIRKMKK